MYGVSKCQLNPLPVCMSQIKGFLFTPSTSGIVNWSITRRLKSVEIGPFLCQVKISAASHGTQLGGVAVRIWGAELQAWPWRFSLYDSFR